LRPLYNWRELRRSASHNNGATSKLAAKIAITKECPNVGVLVIF
jgi:hypothetical protein